MNELANVFILLHAKKIRIGGWFDAAINLRFYQQSGRFYQIHLSQKLYSPTLTCTLKFQTMFYLCAAKPQSVIIWNILFWFSNVSFWQHRPHKYAVSFLRVCICSSMYLGGYVHQLSLEMLLVAFSKGHNHPTKKL